MDREVISGITPDTSRAARQKALNLGAKDFLPKPIDTEEVTLRLYNLLLTRWLYRQMESRNQLNIANACATGSPPIPGLISTAFSGAIAPVATERAV